MNSLRFQGNARRHPFVLKCDIRKCFPSIDHAILKQEIRWKIHDSDLLWLADLIIDHSNEQEPHVVWFDGDDLFSSLERRRGLPIGNLTSQFWANVYLNRFDHFVKETLRCPGYIRYVDDFVLFADSKEQLHEWRAAIEKYLAERLRMIVHPDKTQIYRVADGVPFLGFQVFPHYKYVRKEKVKRWKRLLRKRLKLRAAGLLPPQKFEDQLNAWLGHVRHGQSKRLEYGVFYKLCHQNGVNLFRSSGGSWRVLEQQPRELSRIQP